jgi:hypothetical protein
MSIFHLLLSLDLDESSSEAALTAWTFDMQHLRGADSVHIVPDN